MSKTATTPGRKCDKEKPFVLLRVKIEKNQCEDRANCSTDRIHAPVKPEYFSFVFRCGFITQHGIACAGADTFPEPVESAGKENPYRKCEYGHHGFGEKHSKIYPQRTKGTRFCRISDKFPKYPFDNPAVASATPSRIPINNTEKPIERK